ncbi:dihydrofolate reductase family protein [Rubinisphaera margarita]|uniref:dihydrofolate reductase family protein n=1 Tax=Rubinisphaera margarita TaxID=2909586 RepID=UPI001EE8B705|nr:dihydrofolate reductase family protein [Rubinisphaera margarita]MCG6157529.1 dihydrofolate reductase family protein [Rubinisphaera margarita]
MSKVQYYTASSLDGFIATKEHYLDWLLQFGEGAETDYESFIADVGALAMGSHTYEWVVKHLEESGTAWPYSQPAWIFSTRELDPVAGADVRFVRGDVEPIFRDMQAAANGKNIWIVGGGELAGKFHDAGLLDELFVQITPVTLGAGCPVLPRNITTPPLRLRGSKQFGNVFVELHYEVPRRTH